MAAAIFQFPLILWYFLRHQNRKITSKSGRRLYMHTEFAVGYSSSFKNSKWHEYATVETSYHKDTTVADQGHLFTTDLAGFDGPQYYIWRKSAAAHSQQ